jgi:ribonuclease Z
MRAFVEVLGAGNDDAAAGLLLFFDDARYMFECGDGTQRYCTERGVRLARLRAICLSSLAAPSVGGLLGMVLTIADAGKDQVTIAGPRGVSALFAAARRCAFCHRPAMDTRLVDVPVATPYIVCDDENVAITAVPVAADGGHAEPAVLSYVCRLRDIPGKFNPARAAELGVPTGPAFGRLKKGEPVTLPDGRVVDPASVVSPSVHGPLIIVASCPSERHVAGVVANPALCPLQLGVAGEGGVRHEDAPVCVVYHRSPREAIAHPEYKAWCRRFGPAASHVTLHATLAPDRVVFASQAKDLDMLRRFDADRFRAPWQSVRETARGGEPEGLVAQVAGSPEDFLATENGLEAAQWRVGDCGQQFLLAPVANSGFSDAEVPPRFVELPNTLAKAEGGLWRSFAAAEQNGGEADGVAEPGYVSRFDRATAEVCMLGTAGAIPGKHRNVSGIYLHMFTRGGVLMDCGEGTWGQMTRCYGIERSRGMLRALSVIFISHIHADHHLGLLTLLYERDVALAAANELNSARLVIVGPQQLGRWLEDYRKALHGDTVPVATFTFCDARSLTEPQASESNFFADNYGLDIGCVEVIHCPNSYGIVICDKIKEWSVVYSGDTRPCRALAQAGQKATLAIHEATLDDSMGQEAIDKNHSTTSEALTVCGEWMGAWRTILTHFSQRYPRVPLLDDSTMNGLRRNRATIAFDLMRVNFADLAHIPEVMPAVREAFTAELKLMLANA